MLPLPGSKDGRSHCKAANTIQTRLNVGPFSLFLLLCTKFKFLFDDAGIAGEQWMMSELAFTEHLPKAPGYPAEVSTSTSVCAQTPWGPGSERPIPQDMRCLGLKAGFTPDSPATSLGPLPPGPGPESPRDLTGGMSGEWGSCPSTAHIPTGCATVEALELVLGPGIFYLVVLVIVRNQSQRKGTFGA